MQVLKLNRKMVERRITLGWRTGGTTKQKVGGNRTLGLPVHFAVWSHPPAPSPAFASADTPFQFQVERGAKE